MHRTPIPRPPTYSILLLSPQVDVICLMAEKSQYLHTLYLNMNQKLDRHPRPCSWTKVLRDKTELEGSEEGGQSSSVTSPITSGSYPESEEGSQSSSVTSQIGPGSYPTPPLSMTCHKSQYPNWPNLFQVNLQNCRVEYSFLRVLLSNAPELDNLKLIRVSFSGPEVTQQADEDTIQCKQEARQSLWKSNANMDRSRIVSMSLWHVEGLNLLDVLQFASNLPHLSGFRCCLEGKTTQSPDVSSSDQESATTFGGFKSLHRLTLHNSPCKETTNLFQSAKKGIPYFTLLDSPMNEALAQALVRTLHARVLKEIEFKNVDLTDCEHALHLLLSSLPDLETFCVRGGPMVCDPAILGRESWVCSDLKCLVVKPKCDGGGQSYSKKMSQDAFMKQVASLQRLCYLDFEADDEDGNAYGFAPEECLEILGSMERLRKINLGERTYRRMTEAHAVHIAQSHRNWGWRQAYFFGVPVMEGIPFVLGMEAQVNKVYMTGSLD